MSDRDCKHGNLVRSCELCEMEKEIESLREQLRVAREELRETRERIEMLENYEDPGPR